jgi:tetratricopeptide (TPR) repeat protein
MMRALFKNDADDKEGSLADWDRAIALAPTDEDLYYARAELKYELLGYDKSIADATNGLVPSNPFHYYERAVIHYMGGYHAKGLQDIDRALALDSSIALFHFQRGKAYCSLGDHAKAITIYTKSIALDSLDAYPVFNRARCYHETGKFREAIEGWDRTIQLDPDYADVYYNRAMSKFEAADYKGALADLDKAKQIDSTDDAPYYRGVCKYHTGDYAGALHDFNLNILVDGNDARSLYWRGRSKIALGKKDEACEDWKKARKMGVKEAKEEIKKNCR